MNWCCHVVFMLLALDLLSCHLFPFQILCFKKVQMMSRIIAHGQTHSHAWTDDLVCSSSGVHVSMELHRWYFYYQHLDDFMVDLNRENKPKKTLEDAAALTSPAHLVVTGKKGLRPSSVPCRFQPRPVPAHRFQSLGS